MRARSAAGGSARSSSRRGVERLGRRARMLVVVLVPLVIML